MAAGLKCDFFLATDLLWAEVFFDAEACVVFTGFCDVDSVCEGAETDSENNTTDSSTDLILTT